MESTKFEMQSYNVDTTRRPSGKNSKHADGEEEEEEREHFDNLFQYLLACIGFAVGLGNVWRFPKVALENGGGAFIIPWLVVLIVQGLPLMIIELSVGQRFRGGPMHSFGRMNKLFWGIGMAMGIVSLYISLFYNSILAYGFIYFFNSFTSELPWLTCPESAGVNSSCTADPVRYYFVHTVINAAPDLEHGSGIVWPLYMATVVGWFVLFCVMLLGVKSLGKVIYFTALYPYVMLTILFIIGVSSDGASHGLKYLFTPDWSKIYDPRVWQAASEQVFFSASLAIGGLIAMSSYMPVKNNTYRDSIVILVVNSSTSIFAAIGIFSIKGHMAKDEFERCQSGKIPNCNTGWSIKNFVEQDDASAGLVFISMAKAIDLVGDGYGKSVLAVMFYLMIITLGLDSAFGSLESYLSILKDFGITKRFGYKTVLAFCVGFSCIFALLFSSVHGTFFIDIFDKYGCVPVLTFIGLAELIAVGWIYGFNNFVRDFKILNDFSMDYVLMFLLKYLAPISIFLTIVGQFVIEGLDDLFLTYNDGQALPPWAKFLCIFLFLGAVLWIPGGAILTFISERKNKPLDWGRVDYNEEAMINALPPPKRFPSFFRFIFCLKQYDFPENL